MKDELKDYSKQILFSQGELFINLKGSTLVLHYCTMGWTEEGYVENITNMDYTEIIYSLRSIDGYQALSKKYIIYIAEHICRQRGWYARNNAYSIPLYKVSYRMHTLGYLCTGLGFVPYKRVFETPIIKSEFTKIAETLHVKKEGNAFYIDANRQKDIQILRSLNLVNFAIGGNNSQKAFIM